MNLWTNVFAYVFLALIVVMRYTGGLQESAFVSLGSALLWAYLLQHVGTIGVIAVQTIAKTKTKSENRNESS